MAVVAQWQSSGLWSRRSRVRSPSTAPPGNDSLRVVFWYTSVMNKQTHTEEFKVNKDEIVATIKKIVKEGNARRISIKNEKGESIVEFPLTIGAVGVLLAPMLAAVGAIAAVVTDCTIVVEKRN